MKQSKSSAPVPTNAECSKSKENTSKLQFRTTLSSKRWKSIAGIICLAIIVIVYVLAHRNFSSHSEEIAQVEPSNVRKLEIEVVDGAGSMKNSQRIRDFLSSNGYDVVEMKRNKDGIIERTFVLDRSGNMESARQLADILGISQDKVFQKIDRKLYLDITVVIGKDISQLKSFTERNKH